MAFMAPPWALMRMPSPINNRDAADGGGTAFVRLLCDGPMSFAICGVSPYCHANGARSFEIPLIKQDTRGVTFLWRYGACLSGTEGHQPVMDPRFPPINCCPTSILSA